MNAIKGLDRYLTSEPEDNFTPFVEAIYNEISDVTYTEHWATCFEQSPLESKWLEKLFTNDRSEKTPAECAALITRAYKMYFKYIPLSDTYKKLQLITPKTI